MPGDSASVICWHASSRGRWRQRRCSMRAKLLCWILIVLCQAAFASPPAQQGVQTVDSIGITVNDLDRAVDFYTQVLTFEKVAEREVAGDPYEHLYGVFGMRLRVARLRLGDESIELMQFVAPRGRPMPADSRSNDHWFQ